MALFRVNIKATTPGLASGVVAYQPNPGEILRDAWLEVVTAWNASPACADVGTFVGSPKGLYGLAAGGAPVDVTAPDVLAGGSAGDVLVGGTESDLAVRCAIAAASPAAALRMAPARFTGPAPLLAVVSKDGTNGGGETPAAATAGSAPTIPAAISARVTATNPPTIPAPVPAYVVASAPARVGEVRDDNETFQFGPAGSEVLYTVAAGTYATLADLEAAMLAATGGSGTFGDFVTLADDGATITATAKAGSGADNGWDFQSGTGGDFLHHFFNVSYAYPGFAAGDTLAGGSAGGLVVTTGANDTFKFGAPGGEVVYTVAAGTYTTLADVANAMLGAENPGHTGTLFDIVAVDVSGTKLEAVTVLGGVTWNGWDFLTGATDFLAASGFANAQSLEGGVAAGLAVITGTNDTFKFGAPGGEVVYTVAAGLYTTLAEVEAAMGAAVDPATDALSVLVTVTDNGTELVATAVTSGAGYNGWDFLAGAHDFLADSGFANAQALEGGTAGGTPTGATEGELNLYLDVEASYPPAPWYAPTKPNVPAFPWAGQV